MTDRLSIIVSPLAADHIRAAAEWWQTNRSKAPAAFREDLDRATELIALQPELGARARNAALVGVRRLHLARIRYDLYYRTVDGPPKHLEILACWHSSRGEQPPI